MSFLPYLELKHLLEAWKAEAEWTEPKDISHGLLSTNLAFRLASEKNEAPTAIASGLTTELNSYLVKHGQGDYLEAATAGPYINLALKLAAYNELPSLLETQALVEPVKRKVMLEYIGANVAKHLHAGHMRNLNLGDALRRILELKYSDGLITDNHWGDWGVQFGALIWGYKREVNQAAYAKDPVSELERVYVWSNAQKDALPDWENEIREEFVKLEQGDPENRKLWEEFVRVSKTELKQELNLLGVKPTQLELGESAYEGVMAEITAYLEEEKLWNAEGEARYFDLPELDSNYAHFGRCYLISSTGYTTYVYRDVAARIEWVRKYGVETAITVTDHRQNHNFDQAFAVVHYLATLTSFAKDFGADPAKRLQQAQLIHLGYGRLSLTTGDISTRRGDVLSLGDIVEAATSAAKEQIRSRDSDLNAKELARRSRIVALASLKWADLDRDPTTDVVLDPTQITAFEGNTGTYQLYAYARLGSILRKASNAKSSAKTLPKKLERSEEELLQRLYSFPMIISNAAESLRVNLVADHIGQLTSAVSTWYESTPILKETDEVRKASLLLMCELIMNQLRTGLSLLGIEVLEEL